ncbi:FBD-associated F-box protein At2g26860 isoform X1 [Brassica napus]|nr:FBD-associated F-box protein At2g26860 isoform X1 [Brassica napus]XP_048612400.1 FBD-associated F-box protein At2g26860 isoform X1 [Brassica napus]
MDRISGLPDELLVRILTFVPTKVAVSTSILSKRWEFLWTWVPKLEFVDNKYGSDLAIRDFINKNLPLLKAPVIESFLLKCYSSFFQPEDINQWVATTVSRRIVELDIDCQYCWSGEPCLLLPSSLFTCESLVTLKLNGEMILLDVPRTVSLPKLKTLHLGRVTYLNNDCFRLLISYCPALEDLVIERNGQDNMKTVAVISASLQRLTLPIGHGLSPFVEEYVIVTPSLKYFKVEEYMLNYSYLVRHMPEVEEADINVHYYLFSIFDSITSVKRLSLCVSFNIISDEYMYHDGIFFNRLEHLKLCIRFDYWSKLLFRLLHDSPNLRVLNLCVSKYIRFKKYEPINWNSSEISVPSCLLESLETFEFAEYRGSREERDFVSFIIRHACHLKSSTITPCTGIETDSVSESSDEC